MSARTRALAALAILVLAGAAVYVASTWRSTTSITRFLPVGEGPEAAVVEAMADSDLARTLILTVAAPEPEQARSAARTIGRQLGGHAEVAWVRTGVDPASREEVFELYFPHRHQLVSPRPAERIPERLSTEGLRERAKELRAQLASPTGALARRIAPDDPLLVFLDVLERLEALGGDTLGTEDGVFATPGGEHAVVLASSRSSPFDTEASRRLLEGVDAAVEAARSSAGTELTVERSALHRFAVHNEQAIRADIRRVSIASTIGVLLLFLVVFRSVRSVVLVFVPVASGVLLATAATLAVYGRVHGLTLAFGATLIGVAVDYGVHLLAHHAVGPPDRPAEATRRAVWPAVRLGALTTVAGFAGLAWTELPGIREMALFASAGAVGALLTARTLLPVAMGPGGRAPALQRRLANGLAGTFERWRRRRVLAGGILVAGVAVAAVGIPKLRWVDAPRALQQVDPELLAEEERVRGRVGRPEGGILVAALGSDMGAALEINDRVHRILEDAAEAGELGGFRSIHDAVWSPALQEANVRALRQVPDLRPRFERVFAEEGFVPERFAPFFASLERVPDPLTFDAVAGSPLGGLVRPARLAVGERVAVLSFLDEVTDPAGLRQRLAATEGAVLVDRSSLLSDAYAQFRRRTLELMGLGLAFVLALVGWRYRRWRLALAAFLPAVVAGAASLGVLGLLGQPANLLHVVACLLVLSIGVDYGVFMVEHRRGRGELGATLMAILIACLTTVASFGHLALSSNPALRAVGTTTAIGVLFALVLAPTALALLERDA